MEEEERLALARLEHLDDGAVLAEHEQARGGRRAAHAAAPTRDGAPSRYRPGFTRSSTGSAFGQATSSCSAKSGRRCGSTWVAHRYVLRFTRSAGAEPMCSPRAKCPMRSERASSSSCWRTVAGEPATM